MKRDLLPNLENEPLAVRTLYPDPDYFQEWSEVQDKKQQELEELFSDRDPDVLGITHTDADGYGCEVMLREAFPDTDLEVITASENGPLALKHVGKYVKDNLENDTQVYIMDLAPNEGDGREFIDPFRSFSSVTVVDHHEWSEEDYEQIDWVADVHHDTDRCATQIVHDDFIDDPRETITDLADLTADHDLWLKERREESDALSDLSHHCERQNYVELAREHGSDVIHTEEGEALVNEAREIREKKTELAINRSTYHDVNGQKIGIAYGQCSGSDVGEKLYDNQECDLACIVYPNGNLSFRSPDDNPVARDVAVKMDGGGHPCAAGAKFDILDHGVNYTTFWSTKGRSARKYLLEVISEAL